MEKAIEGEKSSAVADNKVLVGDAASKEGADGGAPTDPPPPTAGNKAGEEEVPAKKRKTRRGKSKRRNNLHPYKSDKKNNKLVKPEAPYNSNRFVVLIPIPSFKS